jgi:hypothetical protein
MKKIKLCIFILRYRGIKWIKLQWRYYQKDKVQRECFDKLSFTEYMDWSLHNEPCGV